MRRGFKAQAEREADAARIALSLERNDPIDPWKYADHLGIFVLKIENLGLEDKHLNQLLNVDPGSWSGFTIKEGRNHFVLLNPRHPMPRQRNTMMHELAHIKLNHRAQRVEISESGSGLMLLSDYPADQENEADWLAAALLLPRDALYFHRSRGKSVQQIADHYGVSKELCNWRLRMTGVDSQLRRSAA
ncbi:MAG: ImmA/IrrE family metallo-endopeptidase [Aquidulcibacter sp.]|nr:ImmA/IrrE family metallo-endopeptidase [Aquidulcibacter sp.]